VLPQQQALLEQIRTSSAVWPTCRRICRRFTRDPSAILSRRTGPRAQALARRSAVQSSLTRCRPGCRVCRVAAYYVVAKRSNTAKHAELGVNVRVEARMRTCTLHSRRRNRGADSRNGSGLIGLTDRVEALGGQMDSRVHSEADFTSRQDPIEVNDMEATDMKEHYDVIVAVWRRWCGGRNCASRAGARTLLIERAHASAAPRRCERTDLLRHYTTRSRPPGGLWVAESAGRRGPKRGDRAAAVHRPGVVFDPEALKRCSTSCAPRRCGGPDGQSDHRGTPDDGGCLLQVRPFRCAR